MKTTIFIFIILFWLVANLYCTEWEYIKGPSSNKFISALETYNNTIYISLYEKLYETNDLGKTWKEIYYINNISFPIINQIFVNKSNIFVRSPYRSNGPFFEFVVSEKENIKWAEINNEFLPIRYYYCVSKNNNEIYATFNAKNEKDSILPNNWEIKKYNPINNFWEEFIDSASLKKVRYPKSIFFNNSKFYFGMSISKYYVDNNIKNTTRIYLYNPEEKSVKVIIDSTTDFWKSHINCFIEKEGVLYIGTSTGVYKSIDEGLTWVRKSEGLHYKDESWNYDLEIHRMMVYEDYIYAIATPPTSSGNFSPSYTNLVYSTDNGEKWQFAMNFQNEKPQDFRNVNDKIILSTYNGLYETDKTLTKKISLLNDTLNSGTIPDFWVQNEKLISSKYADFMYESSNNGEKWNIINSDPLLNNQTINDMYVKDSLYYVCGNYQNLFISKDSGKSFKLIEEKSGLPKTNISEIFIDDANIVYLGTKKGIYFSTDFGDNWQLLSEIQLGLYVYSIEKIGDNIFAGTYKNGLYRSNNNGKIWNKLVLPQKYSDITVNEIKYINNTFFIGTKTNPNSDKGIKYGEGIFVSKDLGESWEKRNTGLPDSCETVNIASYGDYIFAGMSNYGGVYYSSNEGLNWLPLNMGYSGYTLNRLRVFGDYLYCATSTGLYKLNLKEWINGVDETEKKNYLYSFPPYPNPATDVVNATIYWDLALDINLADIKIYDIYGKQVADKSSTTLEEQGPYYGKLTWDCHGINPGVYLITINYGTEKKTIKVCVVE